MSAFEIARPLPGAGFGATLRLAGGGGAAALVAAAVLASSCVTRAGRTGAGAGWHNGSASSRNGVVCCTAVRASK